MSDFTQNLKERIEQSKSKTIEVLEEQNKEVIKTLQASQKHLREALTRGTKKSLRDMKLAEEKLENNIRNYRTMNEKLIEEEQSEVKSRYNIIIILLIIILAATATAAMYLYKLEKKTIAQNTWTIPKKYQHEDKNGKYIIIPLTDLRSTKDEKSVYIQLERGQ